jgi:hypothetical protein
MKIDDIFIKKIYDGKMSLKNKDDKIKLSKYSKLIPMYDIYTDYIYLIKDIDLHYRLVDCHYRFITSEIYNWIKLKIDKSKDSDKIKKYKKLLLILDNYVLDVLEETSYQTLYIYSPDYGLSISICKRNSFHPHMKHLLPYYSRNELIKLGQNNKIIKNVSSEDLVDKNLHYKICLKVSDNDVSYKDICNHNQTIIDNDCINWCVFYSLTGSYLYNDFLRNSNKLSNYMVDGLHKLQDCINKSTKLSKDFYFYRFLWDDKFIEKLKIGDVFTDKGFMSTTRDPFYSPGIDGDFGLILVKINIPASKNPGLLLELFSMFPKEEEYLLMPNSRFKLTSKDDKFKYYHINENFEQKISKKYEFTYVDNNIKKYRGMADNAPEINLDSLSIISNDRIMMCKSLLDMCDEMGNFFYKDKIFLCSWVDSSDTYSKFYHNKSKDLFTITFYEDGYPLFLLEIGKELAINHIRKYHYYNKNMDVTDIDDFNNVIAMIGRIFSYNDAIVYFPYRHFYQFEQNYNNDKQFLLANLYNYPIYMYFKDKTKIYKGAFYMYSYHTLDKIMATKVHSEVNIKFNNKYKNWRELYIDSVENHFDMYNKVEEWMNKYFNDIFKKSYFKFKIDMYLSSKNINMYKTPDFSKYKTVDKGSRFNLIYNDTIRR